MALKEKINSIGEAFLSLFPRGSMKTFVLDEAKAEKVVGALVDNVNAVIAGAEDFLQVQITKKSELMRMLARDAEEFQTLPADPSKAAQAAKKKKGFEAHQKRTMLAIQAKIMLPEGAEKTIKDNVKMLDRLSSGQPVALVPIIKEALPNGYLPGTASNTYNYCIKLPKNSEAREKAFVSASDFYDTFRRLKRRRSFSDVRKAQHAMQLEKMEAGLAPRKISCP